MYKFSDIMSTAEAAQQWGLSQTSVKQLCTGAQGRPLALCRKNAGKAVMLGW